MNSITIYKDHVLYNGNSKEPRPSIDALPLSEFAGLARRWLVYSAYLLRTQKIQMHRSNDFEGSPLEADYWLNFNVTTDAYTQSADPRIIISFHNAYGDDYDYVETVEVSPRSRSDYSRGTKGKMTESRFKIYSATIQRREGNVEIWLRDELTRLKGILDDLDQATRTLRSWADSGLSMKVYCTKLFCRTYDPGIIGSDQLLLHADKGLSLDDFKQKLKCKVCGARCSGMSVV
jgi:hypothetical protein